METAFGNFPDIPDDYGGYPRKDAGVEGMHARMEWIASTLWCMKETMMADKPLTDWESQLIPMCAAACLLTKQIKQLEDQLKEIPCR